MAQTGKPPRERVARALCNLHGHPPDARFEGKAIWESYLGEVDTVISAVMGEETLRDMKAEE